MVGEGVGGVVDGGGVGVGGGVVGDEVGDGGGGLGCGGAVVVVVDLLVLVGGEEVERR